MCRSTGAESSLPEADRTRLHGVCARYLISIGRSAVDAVAHARPAALRGDPNAVTILRRAALECIDSVPRTAAALIFEALAHVVTLREIGDRLQRNESETRPDTHHDVRVINRSAVLRNALESDRLIVEVRAKFLERFAISPPGE